MYGYNQSGTGGSDPYYRAQDPYGYDSRPPYNAEARRLPPPPQNASNSPAGWGSYGRDGNMASSNAGTASPAAPAASSYHRLTPADLYGPGPGAGNRGGEYAGYGQPPLRSSGNYGALSSDTHLSSSTGPPRPVPPPAPLHDHGHDRQRQYDPWRDTDRRGDDNNGAGGGEGRDPKTAQAVAFLQKERQNVELEHQKSEVQRLRQEVAKSMETLQHLKSMQDLDGHDPEPGRPSPYGGGPPGGPGGYPATSRQGPYPPPPQGGAGSQAGATSAGPPRSILKKPRYPGENEEGTEVENRERTNYCAICSIQFNTSREYDQHCAGLLHTKQLMQKKMGISVGKNESQAHNTPPANKLAGKPYSEGPSSQGNWGVDKDAEKVKAALHDSYDYDYDESSGSQMPSHFQASRYDEGGNVECKICSKNFFTYEELRKHCATETHSRQYLVMQASLGTEKFLAKYGDLPFGMQHKDTSGPGDRFIRTDLHPRDQLKYKEFLARTGTLNKFNCRVCVAETFLMEHWLAHCCGKRHARACVTKLSKMSGEEYLRLYGDIPGPAPSKSVDAKMTERWELVYIIDSIKKPVHIMSNIQKEQMRNQGHLGPPGHVAPPSDPGRQPIPNTGLLGNFPGEEKDQKPGAPYSQSPRPGMGQPRDQSPYGDPAYKRPGYDSPYGQQPPRREPGYGPGPDGYGPPGRTGHPSPYGTPEPGYGQQQGYDQRRPYDGSPADRAPPPRHPGAGSPYDRPPGPRPGMDPGPRPGMDPHGRPQARPEDPAYPPPRDPYANPYHEAGPPRNPPDYRGRDRPLYPEAGSDVSPGVGNRSLGPRDAAPPGGRDYNSNQGEHDHRGRPDSRNDRDRKDHRDGPTDRDRHGDRDHRDNRDGRGDRDNSRDHRGGSGRSDRDHKDSSRDRDHRDSGNKGGPSSARKEDDAGAVKDGLAELAKGGKGAVVSTTKALQMLHQLQEKQRIEQEKLEKQVREQRELLERQKRDMELQRKKYQEEMEKQNRKILDEKKRLEEEKRREEMIRKEKERELERERKLRQDELRRQQQMKDDLERKRRQRQKEELERKKLEKLKEEQDRKVREEKERQEALAKQLRLKLELEQKLKEELENKKREQERKAQEELKKRKEEEIQRLLTAKKMELEAKNNMNQAGMPGNAPWSRNNQPPPQMPHQQQRSMRFTNPPPRNLVAIPRTAGPRPAYPGMPQFTRPMMPATTASQVVAPGGTPIPTVITPQQAGDLVYSAPWNSVVGVGNPAPSAAAPKNNAPWVKGGQSQKGAGPGGASGSKGKDAQQPDGGVGLTPPWGAGNKANQKPPWAGKGPDPAKKTDGEAAPWKAKGKPEAAAPWKGRDAGRRKEGESSGGSKGSDKDGGKEDIPWKRRESRGRSPHDRRSGREDHSRSRERERESRERHSREKDRGSWRERERDRGDRSRDSDRRRRKTPPGEGDIPREAPWHRGKEGEEGADRGGDKGDREKIDAPWSTRRPADRAGPVEPGNCYKIILHNRELMDWEMAQEDFIRCMDKGQNVDHTLRAFTSHLRSMMHRIQSEKDNLPADAIMATLTPEERSVVSEIQRITGLEPPAVVVCTLQLLQSMAPRVFNILGTMDPNFMQSLISDAMATSPGAGASGSGAGPSGGPSPRGGGGPPPRGGGGPPPRGGGPSESRDVTPPWMRGSKRPSDQPFTSKRTKWH